MGSSAHSLTGQGHGQQALETHREKEARAHGEEDLFYRVLEVSYGRLYLLLLQRQRLPLRTKAASGPNQPIQLTQMKEQASDEQAMGR